MLFSTRVEEAVSESVDLSYDFPPAQHRRRGRRRHRAVEALRDGLARVVQRVPAGAVRVVRFVISAGHFMLGYLFSEYCAHGRCWALCVQRVHSVLGC